jgi:outer membrane protein OmpU
LNSFGGIKMKKILLSSAALVGVAFAAAPAMAQVDVTVGGHTKNYIGWQNQDDVAGADVKSFDMLRESELHFNAEGTADNGLTYGFHVEAEVDGPDGFAVEESYLYLSSNLGRINLGSEDGANYLLQVAAPSADSNIDGLRQYINPVNYDAAAIGVAANGFLAGFNTNGLDYSNDVTGTAEKITYLSPNWSGFQFGLSYTPDVSDASTNVAGFNVNVNPAAPVAGSGLEDAYEGAVRYEGTFNNVGFAVGAGYTHVENEDNRTTQDDVEQWNIGADFDIGAFGLGAVYTQTDNVAGVKNTDSDTWVVGADYTTGPFQFGVSYLNNDIDLAGAAGDVETDRYTGGVIYTVTQGLTLRGSISFVDHELPGANKDVDATSVLGGIQFNF